MRVLITGGAGFIGHNLTLYLAERGFDVTVLDSLERSTGFALERLRGRGIPVLEADVRSFNGYKNFDVVVHAAAYVSVPESLERPLDYLDNNALGTARVAYSCARQGVRLVYLSSAAVYGNPVKLPAQENHPVNPVSPYGLSKWLGNLAVTLRLRLRPQVRYSEALQCLRAWPEPFLRRRGSQLPREGS